MYRGVNLHYSQLICDTRRAVFNVFPWACASMFALQSDSRVRNRAIISTACLMSLPVFNHMAQEIAVHDPLAFSYSQLSLLYATQSANVINMQSLNFYFILFFFSASTQEIRLNITRRMSSTVRVVARHGYVSHALTKLWRSAP